MHRGFIKSYRKITEWEWYDNANVYRLFMHLLYTVNYEPKKWHGITIEAGQLVTSYEKLAQQLRLTKMQIRTSLDKLKSTGEITHKKTNQYSIITVNNWHEYQENNTQINTQITLKQHSNNTQITPTKESKESKEGKEIYIIAKFQKPTIEEIKKYCSERKNSVNPEQFFNFYQSKGWLVGKVPMKDWKAAVRTWEQKDKKQGDNYDPNDRYGGYRLPG